METLLKEIDNALKAKNSKIEYLEWRVKSQEDLIRNLEAENERLRGKQEWNN